jgi:hypothetical protein
MLLTEVPDVVGHGRDRERTLDVFEPSFHLIETVLRQLHG